MSAKRRIWILAAGRAEAEYVAREGKLHPTEWRPVTEVNMRGFQSAEIWKTPCWWHGRTSESVLVIENVIKIAVLHGGKVVSKPCPLSQVHL